MSRLMEAFNEHGHSFHPNGNPMGIRPMGASVSRGIRPVGVPILQRADGSRGSSTRPDPRWKAMKPHQTDTEQGLINSTFKPFFLQGGSWLFSPSVMARPHSHPPSQVGLLRVPLLEVMTHPVGHFHVNVWSICLHWGSLGCLCIQNRHR